MWSLSTYNIIINISFLTQDDSINEFTRSLQSGTCGCSSCTSSVLNRNASGHSVGARINWLKDNRNMSEQQACGKVCGEEFPSVCSACNPDRCSGGGPSPTPPRPTRTPPTGGSGGSLSVVTQNLYW